MSYVKLHGNPFKIYSDLPESGSKAFPFKLVKTDLSDLDSGELVGKKIILNIFPSVDTPVCAMSVRKFNEEAQKLDNTQVLCISMDLPFAHQRFCAAEGLKNVISLSAFRNREFGEHYGVKIMEGPLAGLFARAVIIIDEKGEVKYTQLVPEISQEPDYDAVIKFLK